MRRLGIVSIVALACLGIGAVPAANGAGVAILQTALPDCADELGGFIPGPGCNTATYSDVTGQPNDMTAVRTPDNLTISDPGVLIVPVSTHPDARCDAQVGSATCTNIDYLDIRPGKGSDKITMRDIGGQVYAGNGNDKVDVGGTNIPPVDGMRSIYADGEDGKDTVSVQGLFNSATVLGRQGDDVLTVSGAASSVVVSGGPGDDTITLDVPRSLFVRIICGTGFDRVYGAPAHAEIRDSDADGRCESVSYA